MGLEVLDHLANWYGVLVGMAGAESARRLWRYLRRTRPERVTRRAHRRLDRRATKKFWLVYLAFTTEEQTQARGDEDPHYATPQRGK